ncbi:hypothetical protein KFL_001050210 [Klebsormidium nitens]|uniref:DM2 domain-containing protein n=1 Tax=Klebsormidium nitens TaxID=105231 RepID=A0A1Y1I2A4_KLENI|nr:hypothetical protein KFL_001050210 [Klebsormidium nitens]|eukprot:GAQ82258.1 hypothetical protein KFL_001050210 [Klebsormidium nitens]
MAPRTGSKKGQKAEPVENAEPSPVDTQDVVPKEPPTTKHGLEAGDDIMKALSKLQRSINKTQKAVLSLQATSQGQGESVQPAKPKKEPSGFAKPSRISNELSSFLGVPSNTRLARTQVTKLLTEYIKKNDLQCPDNRRNIRLDDKLKDLLKVPEGTVVTFFNLQKHCKNHYISEDEEVASELQAIVADFKNILRDTEPKALKKGALSRLKLIGEQLVRSIEAELHTVKRLQYKETDDEASDDSDDEASLGGEHLRTIKDANSGLKIQTSPIPGAGKGLFAWSKHGGNEIVFVPNETICSYDGDVISQAEFDRRYGQDTGPYVAGGQAGLLIDGACKRGAGTVANGRRGHVDSNARFSNSHAGGVQRLTIKATKNIRHGQEIIVPYGADYWRKHRGVARTTR